jgi:hypothetical protein
VILENQKLDAENFTSHFKPRGINPQIIQDFLQAHHQTNFPYLHLMKLAYTNWKAESRKQKIPKTSIDGRKNALGESLRSYMNDNASKYSKGLYREFFEYWTEPNKSGRSMRFEDQKYFDIPRRLATWHSNNQNKYSNNQTKSGYANSTRNASTKFTPVIDLEADLRTYLSQQHDAGSSAIDGDFQVVE